VVDIAAGRAGLGAGSAGHRLFCGAHPRHLLHHGDHGVCADGVLPVLDNKALGGSDGIYVNFKPHGGFFDLDNKLVFYYFTLACLLAVYFFLRRLLFSPFGRALAGIRVNEHRMRAMGFGTFGYKLAAFTLAGALAGLAGYLWGAQTGYVNPELMGFHMSAHAIMMVILGGMGNFAGAIVRRLRL
jgi:branched-chain amino acid transport system permease protein